MRVNLETHLMAIGMSMITLGFVTMVFSTILSLYGI